MLFYTMRNTNFLMSDKSRRKKEIPVFWSHVTVLLPTSDTTTKAKADAKDFWVNMPNLIAHLKKVAEQKPQATYYNVDMLKYQVCSTLETFLRWRVTAARNLPLVNFKYHLEMKCRNRVTLCQYHKPACCLPVYRYLQKGSSRFLWI